jgi:hypothetical protein
MQVSRRLAPLGLNVGADEDFARDAAGAFVTEDLRHGRRSWSDLERESLLTDEQVALAAAAAAAAGMQASFVPPELPDESPSTEALFAEIRPRLRAQGSNAALLATSIPERLLASPRAEPSRPPMSVVHLGASRLSPELLRGLPDASELIFVERSAAEEMRHGGEQQHRSRLVVREVACDTGASEVDALASGLEAAHGAIVLLSTGRVLRCGDWCRELSAALERWRVAGVSPVVRFDSESRLCGRAVTAVSLNSAAIRCESGEEPIPVPLLAAELTLWDRRVIAAAGGLDRGFDTARAAIEELSIRLWRMGFRCCVVPQVEVWAHGSDRHSAGEEEVPFDDRLRMASLHVAPDGAAMAQIRAVDPTLADKISAQQEQLRSRRIAIDALCPLEIDDYIGDFTASLMRSAVSPNGGPDGARRHPRSRRRKLRSLLRGARPRRSRRRHRS